MDKERSEFKILREKAEAKLFNEKGIFRENDIEDNSILNHNLQVHQIELELQNEELRNTQVELEKSYKQFYQLYHKAPVGYVVLTEVGLIAQVNDTFCEMLNCTNDDLLNTTFSKLLPVSDQDVFLARYKAIFKHPKGKFFETEIAHGNTKFFARLEGSNIESFLSKNKDLGGSLLLITVSDITAQKNAENLLIESQKLYESLVDGFPFNLYRIDNLGRLTYLNKNLLNELGKTFDECIGKTAYDFYPKDLAEKFRKDDRKVLTDGKLFYTIEQNPVPNSNNIRFVEVFKIPIRNINNEIVGIQGIFRDITEKLMLENALKENEKKLKELNLNKDKLFSIIAHDLRSPFHGLLGIMDLIIKDYNSIDDKKKFSLMKALYDQSTNVYNLIENLLKWSLFQLNRVEFSPQKTDANKMLSNIILLFSSQFRAKEIELLTFTDTDCWMNVDENMLNTIVRNIVSNAIKFSYRGGRIEIHCKDYDDRFLEFMIKDKGIGIANENLDKIFNIDDKHFSLGTENEKGTGLGLVLCKEFVEKHNGKIWIESEENKGSVFHFTMPKYLDEVKKEQKPKNLE